MPTIARLLGLSYFSPKEMRLVSNVCGCLQNEIFERGCGLDNAVNVEISVADHVFEDECFHFLKRSILFPFFCEVTHTIETLRIIPGELHGFFGIVPEQPDAVAVAFLAA